MPFHPHPLFFLVLGLVMGALVPSGASPWWLTLALGLAAVLALIAMARPRALTLTSLIVACAAAGASLSATARVAYDKHALPPTVAADDGALILEGLVISDPVIVEDEMRLDLDASAVTARNTRHDYRGRVRLFVRAVKPQTDTPTRHPLKGDRIKVWAELREPEGVRTPGGFDQKAWAMREGIHVFATCKSERLLQTIDDRPARRGWMDTVRDRLKRSWRHVKEPLDRAVTASMVLGDDGALDTATRDDFRAAGLLHLLVVSGSQVAALILGLRRIFPSALRLSWTGAVIETAALLGYCALTGGDNSIVRATLMAMAFAFSVRVDLHRGGANFLAASALVLVALRPLDVLDPGAQMSFAATLALVLFATRTSAWLVARKAPGLLADVLATTLVASLAVVPISLAHFHRLSLVALPANMLAAPLAVLLLYGSLATAFLDMAVAPLAPVAGWICGTAAHGLRGLAHEAAQLDPDWRGPSPPAVILIGLAGLALISSWRRNTLATAALVAALTMSGLPAGDGRLHLWFLDVGQGDALILETPRGQAMVIDAGPAFERFDAGERVVGEALWALGHQRVKSVAVTHRHADHEGGAPFISKHFAPKEILVTGPSNAMKDFAPLAVSRGDSWTLDTVTFRILAPAPEWPVGARDENARSLVIEVRFGKTAFLLTGDASSLTERWLNLEDARYDVVKVPHHGAATSSSAGFVSATHPRVALISVGQRNRFSHPNPAVVDRWARGGAVVWRTDLQRTLHVTSDGSTITW